MMKNLNFKSRRIFLIFSFFVLLISLSACSSAGSPVGKLDVDDTYVEVGNYKVTKGELWNELKWNASGLISEKFTEIVTKDYFAKVELVMDKSYSQLTNDEKATLDENLTQEKFDELNATYKERLIDYVIEDVYNFVFSSELSYDSIEALTNYDELKLINEYADSMYSTYSIKEINGVSVKDLCIDATLENDNYIIIAKKFKDLYYTSLAKELIAYEELEKDIQDAYDDRDTDDEDDIGYFTKDNYTAKFKSDFANQAELNAIIIRFSTTDEFESTLRSFGLRVYNNDLVFIPTPEDKTSFSDYCDYYDDLTTSQIKTVRQDLNTVQVLKIYIQMYNFLYGGYRDMIFDESYASFFNTVDLRAVTEDIRDNNSFDSVEDEKAEVKRIADELKAAEGTYDVDTIYTRDDIDNIDSSFNTYLYNTLALPYEEIEDENKLCYSTEVKTYNSSNWIAFKLSEGEDQYEEIYNNDTTNDELYNNIAANAELKAAIEVLLKKDKITDTLINNTISERTEDIKVNIYDEAIEISYATSNSDYSKTYGKAPNENVVVTIEYDGNTYHLNIVEDLEDSKAVKGGLFDTLEKTSGITTAIDILSKKIIKDTKVYEETAEDINDYKEQIEYVLAAFTNDYYSSNGYPSSIGKYNFMMLYFHTANIDEIVNNTYRINGAASKLLTNYNSDKLLNFFKSYSDEIYDNYFSISGKQLLVYLDCDDDGEKDPVDTWNNEQKALAKELVLEIHNELSSVANSHATVLGNLVTEINESARAIYEDNPIAPEEQWARYRKVGLNVELIDISATNETTTIDFKLKQKLFDIYSSPKYSINQTTPSEYLEDLNSVNDVLETKDGYNMLLVTTADFQTSAKFTAEDDPLGLFEKVDVYFNEEYLTISNLYNEEEKLTLEQIRLYVLEYVTLSTSNLSASNISTALTNFLSPVLTRYTAEETQRDIIIYFIENKTNEKINFFDNNEKYEEIVRINHDMADDYLSIYFKEDTTNTLKTYENWWSDIQNIVDEILLTEGENN